MAPSLVPTPAAENKQMEKSVKDGTEKKQQRMAF